MEVADWHSFINAIRNACAELKCEHSGAWYRGAKSCKYRLYPSLLRPRAKINFRHEREIYERAEDLDTDTMRNNNSWERVGKNTTLWLSNSTA